MSRIGRRLHRARSAATPECGGAHRLQLRLGELAIGLVADAAPSRSAQAAPPSGDGGMVFPPYGRSKGAPIAGASVQDLALYISGSRRLLDDPSKSRWHNEERALLAVVEAELERQRGGGSTGSSGRPPEDYDSLAPPDDDIPF